MKGTVEKAFDNANLICIDLSSDLGTKRNQKKRPRLDRECESHPFWKRPRLINPERDAWKKLFSICYDIWRWNNKLKSIAERCRHQLVFNKIYRDKYRRVCFIFLSQFQL